MLLLAGLYLAAAVVYQPTLRSFSVLILIACLFCGAAVASLLQGNRWVRRWTLSGVVLVAVLDLAAVLYVLQQYRPISVAIGVESTEAYLGTGVRYYPAYRMIETNTEADEGVLIVGESRIFHLRRPAIAASYLDPHPIRWFRSNCSAGDCPPPSDAAAEAALIAQRLAEAGISIIYLDEEQYHVESPGDSKSQAPLSETDFFVSTDDDRLSSAQFWPTMQQS